MTTKALRMNWKLKRNISLVILGVLVSFCVLPYVSVTMADALAKSAEKGFTFPVLLLVVLLQGGIYFGLAIFSGSWASAKLGLKMPSIDGFFQGEEWKSSLKNQFVWSVPIGFFAGGLTLFVASFFEPYLPAKLHDMAKSITWQGFPASFYGGIGEELLMRFSLLSLLWLGLEKLFRKQQGEPSNRLFWLANVTIAMVFGVAHILGVVGSLPITQALVLYALLLNGGLGLLFGYCYKKRGLEAAMIAHFVVDLMLHVVPVFFRG